nr:reverse transcriptase domain-containing protein [Tanacetum cinerariifolium]
MPTPFINLEEDERAEETLTDPKLAEYIIKVAPPLVQKAKPPSLRNYVVHQRDPRHPHIPYPLRMNQEKQQEKDEIQIHNFWQMFKQLHINITLADALILIPKYQNMLKALLSNKEKLLELTFLRIARALIHVHGEEMILRDDDERLTLNMGYDTSGYSNQPHKESISMINIYNDSYEDYLEDLFATNHLSSNPTFFSHTDLTLSEVINPLSGNTTSSSPDHLLEEFADELALITFPPENDDLPFDIESDLREIEYFLNHDPTKEIDSILEDSIDEYNFADPNNNHDDPFDSKEDKIKESKLLINELDPPRSSDFFPSPECDSVLYEDFSEVDALPSTNNEDKVFNSGILIHENLSEVTVQVTLDKNVKKISISNASLILEAFNPPLYELPFHKEVHGSETLLSFSSGNEGKVFNPRILTSKGVLVKEYQEKDKIETKRDKNGKRGEAEKSLKQLQ